MSIYFYETLACKNASQYTGMRVNIEMAVLYHMIKHFNLKSFLEIGFAQGKTFGVYLEASSNGSDLTAIDIAMDRKRLYDVIYANSYAVENKNVTLIEIDSLQFKPDKQYDFINVDSSHRYPTTLHEIEYYIKYIKPSGILMLDDFLIEEVDRSIDEFMAVNKNWVPFLMGEQAVFFHHISHSAADFLDNTLEMFQPFCILYNIEYKNHFVKKVDCLPAITHNNDIFALVCERYKI